MLKNKSGVTLKSPGCFRRVQPHGLMAFFRNQMERGLQRLAQPPHTLFRRSLICPYTGSCSQAAVLLGKGLMPPGFGNTVSGAGVAGCQDFARWQTEHADLIKDTGHAAGFVHGLQHVDIEAGRVGRLTRQLRAIEFKQDAGQAEEMEERIALGSAAEVIKAN